MFDGLLPGGYFYNLSFFVWVISLWIMSRRKNRVENFLVSVFFLFWAVNSAIGLLVLIQYDIVFTFSSFVFLIMFVLCGAVGLNLSFRSFPFPHLIQPVQSPSSTVFFFGAAALAYLATTTPGIVARIPILLGDFSALRVLHWEDYESAGSLGFVNVIGAFARGASFAFVIMAVGGQQKSKKLTIAGWFILFVIAVDILSQAGRSVLIFLIFAVFFSRTLANSSGFSIKSLVAVDAKFVYQKLPLFIFGFFLFVIFPYLRGVESYFDYDVFLEFRHNSRISPYIKYLNDNLLLGLSSIAFSTDYFTTPVVKMTNLLTEVGVGTWYSGGAFSFSVPAKIMSLASGVNLHQALKTELELEIAQQGYLAIRPWTTVAIDFAIDFGVVGACIAAFMIAFFLTFICSVCARRTSFFHLSIIAVIGLSYLIMPFKNPYNVTIIANCLFIQLLVLLILEVSRKLVKI